MNLLLLRLIFKSHRVSTIASIRRNPILADILSLIDYMKRRGSGLKRMALYVNHVGNA